MIISTRTDLPVNNNLPRQPGVRKKASRAIAAWLACGLLAVSPSAFGQTLGTAEDFAVLGSTTVTNTGPTVIHTGNLGVSPQTAVTGFPPGIVAAPGVIHSADAVAAQAQADASSAYNQLAGVPLTQNLSGTNLGGGLTLTAGVYRFDSDAQLSGTLSLDLQGDPNAQFIFQIGSTLLADTNSLVEILNGTNTGNIFWQVGSSATLGTNSTFLGTIIALASITLDTGASLEGRALALNGAVTLDTNDIRLPILILPPGRFWTGAANSLWSGNNWSPDASGAASSTLAPDADVVFSATGALNQSTVLDGNTTISSLTVNDPAAVTISGPGLLSIAGAGAQTGITINGGAGLTTINSDLALSGPAQAITVHNAAGLVINGAVHGADGLTKEGAGDLVLTGANHYVGATTIREGTLAVDGSIVGDTLVAGGTLRGIGAIGGSVVSHALVQPGGATSPGELSIGGDYAQSPAGALSIRLASPDSHDLLTIAGSAFLSGALHVSYLDGFDAQVGDIFTILTAEGGVFGEFDSFIDDHATGTLLGLKIIYEPNAVLLQFTQGLFSDLEPVLTPNELQVAKALDKLAANQPDNKLIQELNTLQIANIPGALSLLSPEDFAALFSSGFAIAQVQMVNLERRLSEVRMGGSGFSNAGFAVTDSRGAQNYDGKSAMSMDGKTSLALEGKESKEIVETEAAAGRDYRWGFFISGTGTWGDLESSSLARGSNFATGGVTVGADYRVNRHLVVGAALGYANTSSDLSRGGDLDIDGGKGSLYATLYGGGFYLNGIVGAGYGSINTRRRTVGGFAHGQTDAIDFSGLLGAGYDIHHGAFTWGPVASLQYGSVGIDSFTEHGALGALRISAQSEDSLKSAVGLKASYRQRIGRVVLTPEIRAQWQHEYLDSAASIDAGFASGSSFTVLGPDIGQDALLLDAGVSAQLNSRVAIFTYYTGELGRENYTVHSINGGVRVSF